MAEKTNRNLPLSPAFGALCALAATAIWSGNFIISRGLADAIPPASLAFLRWSVATAAVAPLAARAVWRQRGAVRANIRYLLLTSVLGVTVFNTVIYMAGHGTDSLNMSLIAASTPVFIVVFSRIFLGEAIPPRRALGLGAAAMGMVVLVCKGDLSVLAGLEFHSGDLWMVLAAMIFAVYTLLVRKKPAGLGQMTMLGTTFGLGLAMLVPWTVLENMYGPAWTLTPGVIGAALYIGLGASLCSYFLWNLALEAIGPAKSATIYYSLPLFCAVEALLILGEPITMVHGAGFVLIIGGVFTATR